MLRSAGAYVRRHHLGLLALFVALGGTAYAATELPPNSVGTKQLRKGAVRTADIRAGAVKLGKLDKAARKALKGQVGPEGPAGPTGATGNFGSVVLRFVEFSVPAESLSGQKIAECEPGEVAVGGGVGFATSPGSGDAVVYSGPGDGEGAPLQGQVPTAWEGTIRNSESGAKNARVYAVCAK